MNALDSFKERMTEVNALVPREVNRKQRVAQPIFTRRVVTIAGIKTVKTRFLPVSHEGYGNESYVDKLELLGKTRAEFISRKLKGIERRAHMGLFRELVEQKSGNGWKQFFTAKFDKECTIPDNLCIACWNCSLFGGLEAGKGATFSRIRYFDTYSIEDASDCIAMEGSEEGMGIGNQVYEDVNQARGAETYHLYEYVKAGARFPFITIIEGPTLLDVAGYLHAVHRADEHGYGKYSANHGKFDTRFLVVATGYPRFSVLDMLQWADEGTLEERFSVSENHKEQIENESAQKDVVSEKQSEQRESEGKRSDKHQKEAVRFDDLQGSVALFGKDIESLAEKFTEEFDRYFEALQKMPEMKNPAKSADVRR